jgi:hypothetical protein
MKDQRRVNAMADELLLKADTTMDVSFSPLTVMQLTGLVQLALRHPGVSATLRFTAARFLSAAREYFADCPETLAVIQLGDDPANDVEVDS